MIYTDKENNHNITGRNNSSSITLQVISDLIEKNNTHANRYNV